MENTQKTIYPEPVIAQENASSYGNTFMEVNFREIDSMGIDQNTGLWNGGGKIAFVFGKRNTDMSLQDKFTFYLSFPEFYNLMHRIENDVLCKNCDAERTRVGENPDVQPQPIFVFHPAGTPAEKLTGDRFRGEGVAESRSLSIMPCTRSKSAQIQFVAERGDGKKLQNGLITPKYDRSSKDPKVYFRVAVGFSYSEFIGKFLFLKQVVDGVVNKWAAGSVFLPKQI